MVIFTSFHAIPWLMEDERPALDKLTDPDRFTEYYYLKEELTEFCRRNGLQTSGSKKELTGRICRYLSTGERIIGEHIPKATIAHAITDETLIEPNAVCSQTHRRFFEERIGGTFRFHVEFQKWLRSNAGMTYGDAVVAYIRIRSERKEKMRDIEDQFRYNAYIRDFFSDNPGRTLDDAIKCWKHKKCLPGNTRYERSDTSVLR